jgi:hypothetical protein
VYSAGQEGKKQGQNQQAATQGAAGNRRRVFAILRIAGALGLTVSNPAPVISTEGPAQPARSGEISLPTQGASRSRRDSSAPALGLRSE